jgi:hypothetical protein
MGEMRNRVSGSGLDLSGSGWGPVSGGDELSGSIKGGEFID